MDIQEAIDEVRVLRDGIRARGWKGDVSVLLNWGLTAEDVNLHVQVSAPTGAGGQMKDRAQDLGKFFGGSTKDIDDLFKRAQDYIDRLPNPEDEALGDVVARVAQIAESAEHYGLNFDENGQAWDGLAAFLRKSSQQLAERGLPRPEQFHGDPIAPEED